MQVFWGKVEVHYTEQSVFTLYYARKCEDATSFLKWLKHDTNLDLMQKEHINIVDDSDVRNEFPNWFIKENKDRYNGYGFYQTHDHLGFNEAI
jgi:hypothetical protein